MPRLANQLPDKPGNERSRVARTLSSRCKPSKTGIRKMKGCGQQFEQKIEETIGRARLHQNLQALVTRKPL